MESENGITEDNSFADKSLNTISLTEYYGENNDLQREAFINIDEMWCIKTAAYKVGFGFNIKAPMNKEQIQFLLKGLKNAEVFNWGDEYHYPILHGCTWKLILKYDNEKQITKMGYNS